VSSTAATFLFETANFLLLAAALGWLFFRPLRATIERRRGEIEEERRAAAEAREQAERALEEARKQQAALEGSRDALRAQARREAEGEREQLLEAARAQAQRERESLEAEHVASRRGQAQTLARDAAFAAREIVARLLDGIGGPELEPLLVRAACRALAELRAAGPLAPVIVESARALEADALAALAQAAGVGEGEVARRVAPELLGGLRVVTARGVVDLSASGFAASAERALLARLAKEAPDA